VLQARKKMQRKQGQEQWQDAEETAAGLPLDIYKRPAMGRSDKRGNFFNKCTA